MNITRPTLIINTERVRNNIRKMAEKAESHNLSFRPHFKTHQSAEIGEIYKSFGINSCTVSSVEMAEYFAENGWNDITIAFPFNKLEIDNINELVKKIKLNLLAVDAESIEFLKQNLKAETGIFIEIDTGYNRTGIDAGDYTEISNILNKISKPLIFKGFLTHSGNTYTAKSKADIIQIHEQN